MSKRTRNLITLLPIMFVCQFCAAQAITVAVAADLQFAMQDVAAKFQKQTGKEVKLIYGSLGNFFQQLQKGAPFDMFFLCEEVGNCRIAVISGDYLRAMGIPLLDGRYFNIGNRSVSTPVVILNESMAKRCWPGQRAIGKRFHVGGPQMKLPWATVVGVVADTKMGFARRT